MHRIAGYLQEKLLLVGRPGRALIHHGDQSHSHVLELLYPFSFVGLGRVNVAFRVGGDAVHAVELPRLASAVSR